MKYFAILFTILPSLLMVDASAQPSADANCRLTMVIPKSFVQAGKEPGVAAYRSKSNSTSLTMTRYEKDAQNEFISALSAAENTYDRVAREETVDDLNIYKEKIGKTDFMIVSWIDHGSMNGFSTCMTAFNSDCEILYKFEMTSPTSSKEALDKEFRSFLRSCKRSKTN